MKGEDKRLNRNNRRHITFLTSCFARSREEDEEWKPGREVDQWNSARVTESITLNWYFALVEDEALNQSNKPLFCLG